MGHCLLEIQFWSLRYFPKIKNLIGCDMYLPMFRAGYVEHLKRAGERVTSFRLGELEAGNLQYVEKGQQSNQVGFQAWDGEQYSNTVNLRLVGRIIHTYTILYIKILIVE